MKTHGQLAKGLLAAALLAAFFISFLLDVTGLSAHQWLGIFAGALAGYHLWIHRGWVQAVTRRFFGRTSEQARLFYVVDAGMLLSFLGILLSGLVISSWLNLSLANYAAWRNAHVAVSISALFITVLKIGLHWRWIVGFIRRLGAPADGRSLARTVIAPTPINRRDFIKLVGVMSAAALVALGSVLNGDGDFAVSAADSDATSRIPATPATAATVTPAAIASSRTTTSASATACTVRCNRRCAYPGKCRRYVDRNNNRRCDLGECL